MAEFTLQFPMKLDSGGAIAKDPTSASQLGMLTHTEIGQRIDDSEYGFPPFAFEQETLADETQKPITLVLTQRAIAENIPSLLLGSIEVVREPVNRKLTMEITYMERSRFEPLSRELLDLGLESAS